MKKIYQIEKISRQSRQFAKNFQHIFKLEVAKFRLEKMIVAKKEKIRSSRLLRQAYEGCAKRAQSIKLAQSYAAEPIEWKRRGSSI